MINQIETEDSRCVPLASPKKLYDDLLLRIDHKFGEKETDDFGFSLRDDLPCKVLETRKPLKWFRALEQRGKLSWKDVNCLVDFLSEASLDALLSEARLYQARIKVVEFLHRNLQAKLPELCLDEEFNKKQCLERNVPKHYSRRCKGLFRGTQDLDVDNLHVNSVRCLFSKGVVLLENSCRHSSDDVQLAALKLLYLADLLYKSFKKVIIDDMDLLNIKPLPNDQFSSPKKLYDSLLFHIRNNFGEKEKDDFGFSLRDDLPCSVLETRKPLKWFRALEQRGKLCWKDVNCLGDFLSEASLDALLSETRNYQARIKVVEFFHRNLQAKLPELCLDEEFNKKQCLEQNVPKHYLKRCQELFRGAQDLDVDVDNLHVNSVRCLFSKAVVLLENSCRHSSDVQLAARKLLYLADLLYKRFKKVIVDDMDLLNIKPLSNGRFLSRDNNRSRRRMLANRRRRTSVPADVHQQQLSRRRGSLEFIQNPVKLCISFLLRFFVSLLGIFGGEENR